MKTSKQKPLQTNAVESSKTLLNKRQVLDQSAELLEADEPVKAIELLDSIIDRYPRDVELLALRGFALVQLGEMWDALICYRKAMGLRHNAEFNLPLGFIYMQLGLHALALRAFRQVQRIELETPIPEDLFEMVKGVEGELDHLGQLFGVKAREMEEGLYWMEEAQIALHQNDYLRCIQLNRKAIRLTRKYPPPCNNLSLALFYSGQPEEAVRAARQVLENFPDNIQALGNLVRFCAWSGRATEAEETWRILKQLPPGSSENFYKYVESAAVMDDDEKVYALLKKIDLDEIMDWEIASQMEKFRAVALANLGKTKAAKKALKELSEFDKSADEIYAALASNKKGLGWTERFSYFHLVDILPRSEMETLIHLMEKDMDGSPRQRREIERFTRRFPQLALLAKKFLYEYQQVLVAIDLVKALATPEAYAMLREFALGQLGSDEDRMHALLALQQAGQFAPGETVTIWRKGKQQQVLLQLQEVRPDIKQTYPMKIHQMLDEGLRAFTEGKLQKAEEIFLRVKDLEPKAKEAYNNLGTIYSNQDQVEKAKAMFQKALELDPLYALPRTNLAVFLIDDDKFEEAEEMIAPLAAVTTLSPHAMVHLSFVRAQLALHREDVEAAINSLEMALYLDEDHEPSQKMLEHLKMMQKVMDGLSGLRMDIQGRRERKRKQEQTKISSKEPSLAQTLDLYSKDVLIGIAWNILPEGGFSGLRKAPLQALITERIQDRVVLKDVVEELTDEERQALRRVLDNGGWMDWNDFDTAYDNDLDGSPNWQWHEPESVMGHLRERLLLVEATVNGQLLVVIPSELRSLLQELV
jgi:Flp pilus assembly protein TadD